MATKQTHIAGEIKCPACPAKIRVQAPVTLYRTTAGRVSVRVAPVYFVHECPAVVPRQTRRSE